MANRIAQQINSSYKSRHPKKTIPQQPDGMPQGRHLQGFKGSKIDAVCSCGRCLPARMKRT